MGNNSLSLMVGSVQNANLRIGIEMYYGPYEEEEPYVCPICGRTYWNDSEQESPSFTEG